jgi:CxxC motif-containing protein (DUF1111 family)
MGDLTDNDDVADPELQPDEVFDLVTFAMLLAPPAPETKLHRKEKRGKKLFAKMGCESCHTPALEGARGMVPLYSDLLLHDMGEDMADGLVMANATSSEFRTQPLWGLLLQRPYLHDGRADTIEEAIRWHGGEAEAARMAFVSAKKKNRKRLIAFLETLGGREQATEGLLAPDAPIPLAGEVGAPTFLANAAERKTWLKGRALFDKDFGEQDGLGLLFNGDSCRGCHFAPLATDGTPMAGGAGPLDVNVMRHGTIDENGNFIAPDYGTILHKLSIVNTPRREHTSAHNFFEVRQPPTALGLGLISAVDADDIRALADPTDADGDGIFGIVHELWDGRVGRLGWKAQVPSVREFVRDAMSAELGMTVPQETGFTFGNLSDDDPALSTDEIDTIAFYMERLAPPMPTAGVPGGEALFEAVGCDSCHVGRIPGSGDSFPVPAYTDLLLHSVAPRVSTMVLPWEPCSAPLPSGACRARRHTCTTAAHPPFATPSSSTTGKPQPSGQPSMPCLRLTRTRFWSSCERAKRIGEPTRH